MMDSRPVVICVDDEAPVLEALKRALRDEPYQVVTTREPREALELLESGRVAAVIADQRMPGTSGSELLEEVRRRSPAARRVILTGFPERELIRARAAEEVDRLLTKPWDKEGLKRTLRQIIRERSGDARDLREVVLSVDCRGRAPEDLLQELRPALTRVDVVRRGLVIFLKNLPALRHSLRGFVERLSLEVARAGVRAYVVEPSGLSQVLLDPLGEIGPLIVFAPKEAGRRVLLVERRATAADFLGALLSSAGHEVVRVSRAAKAEELLRERPFDVLLLDVAAGAGTLRILEGLERRPEIIALTAGADTAGIPARAVLVKPYSARDLLRAISGSPLATCPPS